MKFTALTKELADYRGRSTIITGITESAKPLIILGTAPRFGNCPVLAVVKDDAAAEELGRQIRFWQKFSRENKNFPIRDGSRPVFLLPDFLEQQRDPLVITLADQERSRSLYALTKSKPGIYIVPAGFLNQRIAEPAEYGARIMATKIGQKVQPFSLIDRLIANGYVQNHRAGEPGLFRHQGSVMDVFPPQEKNPFRLEFDEDEIIKIWPLDPKTNRTSKPDKNLTTVKLPLIIVEAKPMGGTLLNYWGAHWPIFVDDLVDRVETPPCFSKIYFKHFPDEPDKRVVDLGFAAPTNFRGDFDSLKNDLRQKNKEAGKRIALIASKNFGALKKNLKPCPQGVSLIDLTQSQTNLPSGFTNERLGLSVLSDREIFPEIKSFGVKTRPDQGIFDQNKIKTGDLVIHVDHGLARFGGTCWQAHHGRKLEYFILEYAGQDRLFVPVDQTDRISRYIGAKNPALNKLGGDLWIQTKRRIKKEVQDIAADLLKVQAKRAVARAVSMVPAKIQGKLADSFPYPETEDQLAATAEISRDLQSRRPMDRLLAGDVGFGKTEVALRTAFQAVVNKKQVVLLAPTTILAQQHFDTFTKRLKGFAAKVDLLSRFRSKKEQGQTVADIKAGRVDIVIGTHRILSGDVRFKNLGLIIIDEEQRFGVKHKEKLKKLKASVHILTLTATPIPRTLHQALAGLRDISQLTIPPSGRLPIKTTLGRYDQGLIREALGQELKRKGQIYYLHNRVQTIDMAAAKIKRLAPKARIAVAHGQMDEKRLARTMHLFNLGEIDVLVASTIIENGLDFPRANTLIVDEATRFGLSELYQLRGRIGRGKEKAFAYFLYRPHKLKGKAKQRLSALWQAQELGSGMAIAEKDLEIRGAGNLLGPEQSGRIAAVGLQLYLELIKQEVARTRGQKVKPKLEVTVDLPLEAYLPEEFFPDLPRRLALYQELSRIEGGYALNKARIKLGRAGREKPVQNLLTIITIKNLARQARIFKVSSPVQNADTPGKIILEAAGELDYDKVQKLLKTNAEWDFKDNRLEIAIKALGKDWTAGLEKSLKLLS